MTKKKQIKKQDKQIALYAVLSTKLQKQLDESMLQTTELLQIVKEQREYIEDMKNGID